MEEMTFEKIESTIVRILSHKKVSVDNQVLDVLALEDIAEAYDEHSEYRITSGKYQRKCISAFNEDFEKCDFCAIPLTLVEKNLLTDFDPSNKEALTLENYKKRCKDNEYFIVTSQFGKLALQITTDERIIEAFKYAVNPSLGDKLSNLIEGSKANGGIFTIDEDTMNQINGKENSLTLEEPGLHFKTLQDYNIEEKYAAVKRKVIGYDEELKVILANITKNISLSFTNFEPDMISELKSNLLILGPSGGGKTFIIKSIAKVCNVPYAIEDSTRYSPTAYQGADLEDILVRLYLESNEKKEVFERGVIFLDEFDKICKYTDPKDHEIKEGTQNSLLTIMQGTTISKKVRMGFSEKIITLDTSNLTFILSGAFEEIIDIKDITPEVLANYGMIRQLANRISTSIRLKKPTKEEMKKALTDGEYSYIKLFKEYLEYFNNKLEVSEDFIDYIVEIAYAKDLGYRGLSAALTEYLNPILFDIYSGKTNVVKLSKKHII